jgi:hypothetical protein
MRGINPEAHVSIFVPEKSEGQSLAGKVLHVGLVNELHDSRYLLVEDASRRVHYVSLETPGTKCKREMEVGQEVSITVRSKRLVVEGRGHDRGHDLEVERN